MSNLSENSMEELLKQLLTTVLTLQNDVNELKEGTRAYPKKNLCDGDGNGNTETTSHNDDDVDGYHGSNTEKNPPEDGRIDTESDGFSFKLSEVGEAFLETACGSCLDYKTRKPKMAKYGILDTKWTIFPLLPLVVEVTFPKDTVKEDKVAYRTQEMYMKAMVLLVPLLDQADSEDFTLKEAIPMIQSAIVLLSSAPVFSGEVRINEAS